MTKKQLEEQLENITASLQQANEVITFVFNVTSLWQKKILVIIKQLKL